MRRMMVNALVIAVSVAPWLGAGALAAQQVHKGSQPLAVSTHGVVKHSTLPHCEVEDGGRVLPCSWNFDKSDGNGIGLSYWIDRKGGIHYVWARSPVRNGWQWLSDRDVEGLASLGGPGFRYWQKCVIKYGPTTRIKCPDGGGFAT